MMLEPIAESASPYAFLQSSVASFGSLKRYMHFSLTGK
jgi:hypothetical protein